MADLRIDPANEYLDLDVFDPEDLVTARVETEHKTTEGSYPIPTSLRNKTEAEILKRLNKDQVKRRKEHLELLRQRTISAAETVLRNTKIKNTNPLHGVRLDHIYTTPKVVIDSGIAESWRSGSRPPAAAADNIQDSAYPELDDVFGQVVVLLQKQVDGAKRGTWIATTIAIASAAFACLALFVPVTLNQPDDRPVPVQIINPSETVTPKPSATSDS